MAQFLYSKTEAIPQELCEKFIDTFEISTLKKEVDSRLSDGSIHKKSTDIYFDDDLQNECYVKEGDLWLPLVYEIDKVANLALSEYYNLYHEFNQTPPVELKRFNMQKYNPGEGFPGWHFERGFGSSDRVLAWMIYLNNVEAGGTEFKYQNHLERAEQGKLLIWPADWTFTHRGQVSSVETKYILTGWYENILGVK
jgi:prolyl 4-hydroxylase